MEHGSRANLESESSAAGDAAFEQLLRLAALYARRKTTAGKGAFAANLRNAVTEDIEFRAYQLYLGRGASHGHDLDDWLQAERQVLEALKKEKTSLRVALAFGLLKSER
jgi:hypothetical protein